MTLLQKEIGKAKQAMTCEGVLHARECARVCGDTLHNCKHNRAKSAHTLKIRENHQGAITPTGSHTTTCFKKDMTQDVPDVVGDMKSVVDDAPLEDLS